MRAKTAFVAVALAVLALAAIPAAGMAATDGPLADHNENSTEDENASVAPGERLSGVVGVQEAELEGEVDKRTFGIEVAQAASNESRADVVAKQLEGVAGRLDETEQRKQELDEARANGSMSEGKYRAEVAELATRTETAKELANESENASQGLPAGLLEEKGINATAIQTLKDRANELTGPEVAEIARGIAGDASPVDAGPEERPGQADEADEGQQGAPDQPGDGDTPEEADGEPDDETTPTPDDQPPEDGGDGGGADGGAGNASDAGDGGDGGSY